MSASSTLPDADEEQHVLAALYGDEADIDTPDTTDTGDPTDTTDTRLPGVPSAFDPQADAPEEEGRDARR
ncbi:hypothetical protein ACQP04_28485 [Pseudonocardia halophobica]|uniref:hypothetical protein n=1 Tax=Pseudonocardia halophobica TaxID=29401 RepID=UPI003D8A952B